MHLFIYNIFIVVFIPLHGYYSICLLDLYFFCSIIHNYSKWIRISVLFELIMENIVQAQTGLSILCIFAWSVFCLNSFRSLFLSVYSKSIGKRARSVLPICFIYSLILLLWLLLFLNCCCCCCIFFRCVVYIFSLFFFFVTFIKYWECVHARIFAIILSYFMQWFMVAITINVAMTALLLYVKNVCLFT